MEAEGLKLIGELTEIETGKVPMLSAAERRCLAAAILEVNNECSRAVAMDSIVRP